MIYKLLFLASIVLLSCKKKEPTSIVLIGHAGMGLEFSGSVYHDNSKEAFQLALDMEGTDGIEMDIRMSSDGDLWAFHDDILDESTDRTGCIEKGFYEDLSKVRYNGFGKEKLMRLKDLNLTTSNKRLLLDIKHYKSCTGSSHQVADFISALNDLPDYFHNSARVRLITSNPEWIAPLIAAGYTVLYSNDIEAEFLSAFQSYPLLDGVVVKNAEISKAKVLNIKSLGKTVYLYEVRSPKALKEVREKEPDGVMSDDVQGAIIELK